MVFKPTPIAARWEAIVACSWIVLIDLLLTVWAVRRPVDLLKFLLILLVVGSDRGGAAAERADLLPGNLPNEPARYKEAFRAFWEAWELVRRKYVDRSAVDTTELTDGAIECMLDALGDAGHTRFLSPEALRASVRPSV